MYVCIHTNTHMHIYTYALYLGRAIGEVNVVGCVRYACSQKDFVFLRTIRVCVYLLFTHDCKQYAQMHDACAHENSTYACGCGTCIKCICAWIQTRIHSHTIVKRKKRKWKINICVPVWYLYQSFLFCKHFTRFWHLRLQSFYVVTVVQGVAAFLQCIVCLYVCV
jgi:hypothetical protein